MFQSRFDQPLGRRLVHGNAFIEGGGQCNLVAVLAHGNDLFSVLSNNRPEHLLELESTKGDRTVEATEVGYREVVRDLPHPGEERLYHLRMRSGRELMAYDGSGQQKHRIS